MSHNGLLHTSAIPRYKKLGVGDIGVGVGDMVNESFGIVPIVVLHVSQLYYTLRRDNVVGRTIFLKHLVFFKILSCLI